MAAEVKDTYEPNSCVSWNEFRVSSKVEFKDLSATIIKQSYLSGFTWYTIEHSTSGISISCYTWNRRLYIRAIACDRFIYAHIDPYNPVDLIAIIRASKPFAFSLAYIMLHDGYYRVMDACTRGSGCARLGVYHIIVSANEKFTGLRRRILLFRKCARKYRAITVIQSCWLDAYYNPEKLICKRRLTRELDAMNDEFN